MDLRYERTERHLREACLGLGAKKDIWSLTVTQVAQAAEVNRITFYSHYDSIGALVERLEEEHIRKFLDETGPFRDFRTQPYEIIRRIMAFRQRNESAVFLRSSKAAQFTQKGIDAIIREIVANDGEGDPDLSRRVAFAVSGIHGVFLRTGLKREEDVIATAELVKEILGE